MHIWQMRSVDRSYNNRREEGESYISHVVSIFLELGQLIWCDDGHLEEFSKIRPSGVGDALEVQAEQQG